MAARSTETHGCWICRLRRKKCDAARPLCGACNALGLQCVYSDNKPEWMDGKHQQKEMAELIKTKIKKTARGRRDRNAELSNGDTFVNTFIVDYNNQALPTESESLGQKNDQVISPDHTSSDTKNNDKHNDHLISPSQDSAEFPHLSLDEEAEASFMMLYLDFVFPFLFPHYRPSVLDYGRHWLLNLTKKNKVVHHTAISLGAYFFAVTLNKAHPENHHGKCKGLVWDQLEKQSDAAIKMAQEDIYTIRQQGATASLIQRARAVESIIYILIFEVMVGKSQDWNMHLKPTLILFSELLNNNGKGNLDEVLEIMARPPWAAMNYVNSVSNTTDQSAIRFFSGILLFIDVISSTALSQPPHLQKYYDNLLGQSHYGNGRIDMNIIVGCSNWVMTSIADISALSAWKNEARRMGTFSKVDLTGRSEPISCILTQGFAQLDNTDAHASPLFNNGTQIYYGYQAAGESTSCTRIWALAATVYLETIISGWQPINHIIRQSVSQGLHLMNAVPSSAQLRALAWPICVLGCLATSDQQQEFRDVITKIGELHVLGTIDEVLRILEMVWKQCELQTEDGWDLSKCLSILGKPVLLI